MAETNPVTVPLPVAPIMPIALEKHEVRQERPAKKTAVPVLGVVFAVGAGLLFHLRRERQQGAVTTTAIAELRAEKELAQKQLRKLESRLSQHLDEYSAISTSNREILDAYDSILKGSEELQSRLERTEAFNRELQMKIKRERSERARCEKKIMQLQKKIEEQEGMMRKQKVEDDTLSARSDDSAKVLEENNEKVFNVTGPTHGQQGRWTSQ